jgi:chromosome segregation ATPase
VKKTISLFAFLLVLLLGAIIFYYTDKLKSSQENSGKLIGLQKETLGKLESQIRELKSALETLQKADGNLKNSFDKEREKVLELRDRLWKSLAQNKYLAKKAAGLYQEREKADELEKKLNDGLLKSQMLSGELDELKAKLDLAAPIKQRLAQLENSLSLITPEPERQEELKMRLESISAEISSLNNNIVELLGIKPTYGKDAQGLTAGSLVKPVLDKDEVRMPRETYKKLTAESLELQGAIEAIRKDYANLFKEYKATQGKLKNSQLEQSARSEKILALQEKLNQAQNQLIPLQMQSAEAEKEVATLKKQYEDLNKEYAQAQEQSKNNQEEFSASSEKIVALQEKLNLAENKSMETQAKLQSAEKQYADLREQYASLKEEYTDALSLLKKNQVDSNNRTEKILALQDKLSQAEERLAKSLSETKGIEKESAGLREQYVAIQLEKEGLVFELDQARQKLAELQKKLDQISNLFAPSEEPPSLSSRPETLAPEPRSKKVEVELLPKDNNWGFKK